MTKYGSDLMAEIIASFDIPFIALNPGASFRGLHDSLMNHPSRKMPEIIECTHEEISVSVAHGYAKATGKIMAAAIHDTVGLQHATMAIFNAWCDRVPMLLVGGTGPMDVDKRRPWIDWIHTTLVQGNLIREFVKYDDQPSSLQSLADSLHRAYRLSLTEPAGPTYVALDAGLQEDPIPEELLADEATLVNPEYPELYAPGSSPAADPAVVARIAEAIRTAKFPLIMADFTGRSAESFRLLSELADSWAIPVIDRGVRLNLPTTHPMNLGDNRDALDQADVIIALDMRDLFGAVSRIDRQNRKTESMLAPGARVFSVGVQDYGVRSWSMDYQRLFPAEQNVLADTRLFLDQLLNALGEPEQHSAEIAQAVQGRHQAVSGLHRQLRQQALETAEKKHSQNPIAHASLAGELWNALREKDFIIANGNLKNWVQRIFKLDQPFQYLGQDGGGGLGYGIGATIGACLAHRNTSKLVVDIQSDGDLLFTPGGLWTLAHHKLPALIIMNNNRSYFNSEEHQTKTAEHRNRDAVRGVNGTLLTDPNIDFAQLANSMGVRGIGPVERLEDVAPALREAIDYIEKHKMPVLVDVVTEKA